MATFPLFSGSGACQNKVRYRKVFSFIVILYCLVAALPACATVYQCNPEQAYVWNEGHLKESTFIRKMGINFQQNIDDVGVLAIGMKAPWAQTTLKIVQKPDHAKDLVAISEEISNGNAENTTLRIRAWDNSNKIRFILSNNNFDASIYIGSCKKVDENKQ